MKYLKTIFISIFYLFFSCSGFKDVAATIQGKNIYLSEIYKSIDKTDFNKLNTTKKRTFIRKYAVHKILSEKPKNVLNEIDLNIEYEENRLKNDLIVQEVEKYISNQFTVTDSILDFVEKALNIDILVKAITVPHRFSFGKASNRSKAEAFERAKTIYNRLSKGDVSYREALSIYSESPPSKIKGNEMGQINFGLMPKNFNDVVWSSPEGKLYGPLETPMGYHVIIVDLIIPKKGKNIIKIDRAKLEKDLVKGKYGYKEESFSKFIESLNQKYDVSIDDDELYNLWDSVQSIEGVKSMSGISITDLLKLNTNRILGKIGNEEITLDWLLRTSNTFSFYSSVAINSGFLFNKFITDVFARYLILQWFDDNKNLFPGFELTLKQKSINKIYSLFLTKTLEHNPELNKDIILNQFMLNEGVVINNELFTPEVRSE